jgi:hypothetical protein
VNCRSDSFAVPGADLFQSAADALIRSEIHLDTISRSRWIRHSGTIEPDHSEVVSETLDGSDPNEAAATGN